MFNTQAAINDPRHWRDRAKEARLFAQEMKDGAHKETMLQIAVRYEALGQRAEG